MSELCLWVGFLSPASRDPSTPTDSEGKQRVLWEGFAIVEALHNALDFLPCSCLLCSIPHPTLSLTASHTQLSVVQSRHQWGQERV